MRSGIRRLLEDDQDIRVVGEAGDGDEALRVVREARPQVVVLDYAMPATSALAVIRRMREEQPRLAIVVVSIHDQKVIVQMVLAAIASGAVAPDVGRQIIEAIGALSAIRATEELEARLAALETRSA